MKAVAAHSNPMLRWSVSIALETGMRSSEITHLRRSQVDLDRRIVRLFETKNTMPRTVPLSKVSVELFRDALNHPARPTDTDLIFFGEPGRDGKRHPYESIQYGSTSSVPRGCLMFASTTCAEAVSHFGEAGLSDQEVSAISGHKSMQMLKKYTHLRAEDLVYRLDRISQDHKEQSRRKCLMETKCQMVFKTER